MGLILTATSRSPSPRPRAPVSFLRTVLSVLVLVVLVVLLSWGLRTFVFQAYEIPSGSMEETIMPGDMVFREDHLLRQRPGPRDIVTFKTPIRSRAAASSSSASSLWAARPSICATARLCRRRAAGRALHPRRAVLSANALLRAYHRLPLYTSLPAGGQRVMGGQPHQFPGFPLLRRHHESSVRASDIHLLAR